VVLVSGLFEDAAVEVQPGQFAIDEALRQRRNRKGERRLRGRAVVPADSRGDFLNRSNSLCAIRHLKKGLKDQMPSRQKWRLDDSSPLNRRAVKRWLKAA